MCHMLIENYGGEVPADFDELVKLPGVGRKTANVVRYELAMRDFDEALTEIESLLLRAYHGKEDSDGGDEDLGDP